MKQSFFEGFEKIEKEQSKKKSKELTCEDCGLYKNCKSPKMKLTGNGKFKILIIAEAPGKKEDEENYQLVGQSGQLLRKCLEELECDLDIHFWKTNSIICRPENNRTPTTKEIKACRKYLFEDIEKYKPKVIIPMGKVALESLIGERITGRIKNVSFSDWVGEIIPDQELKCYICPIYHPAYILRNEYDIVLKRQWKESIKKVIEKYNESFYIHNYESDYIVYTKKEEAIECIKRVKEKNDIIAFDYETTGLKPHKEGHKIICCSISDGSMGYAFPFFDDIEFRKEWRRLVGSKKIRCIAHNARFEGLWTKVLLGYDIKNWLWDTMIAQSIIDNRKKTNLKFLTYIKFGVLGYDNKIDKYIGSRKKGEDEKSDNSFNNIEEASLDELLKYNALDSLFTYKLYEIQKNEIKGILENGFNFFMEGFQSLLQAQINGIRVDLNLMQRQKIRIEKKLNIIEKNIMGSEELKKWDGKEQFKFTSSKQLSHLLYDILNIKVNKETKKGNASVDFKALENIDLPIVEKILKYRRWDKIYSTYFSQYEREQVDGFLHPFFNLGNVKTYRSCIAKGTKILAVKDFIKYPNGVPIENIKIGDYVYCFDNNLKLQIKKVLWAGKTGNKKIIRVYFKGVRGRKGFLDVTPEHKIRLIDGSYVQAKDLIKDYRGILNNKNKYVPKCRVLSVHRYKDKLFITNCKEEKEHRKIYEFFSGDLLNNKDIIHHKDKNHLNHVFSNLEKMNKKKHSKLHYKDYLGTKESREKNIKVVKEKHKKGEYQYGIGVERYNYLNLSMFDCLRLLFKAKGRIKYINYDFGTFKKYCKLHDIDLYVIKLHYNSKNEFIHKNNVIKCLKKYGYDKTYKKLRIGYYKLKKLLEYWNISYEKGKIINNNHLIYKIEYLNKKIDVYDLEIEDYNNFIANEICVHNSSNSPNIQNVFKRDPEAKKIIRSLIISRKGNRLIEYDFKSMEVVNSVCYNKDPNLIKYLKDDSTDMHRDCASELFLCEPEEVDKYERDLAKNRFVFPEFYGSYFEDIAPNLWEGMKDETKKRLKEKGIKSYNKFKQHVENVEYVFWNDKFPVYAKWKEETIKEYYKNGYIELYTGFRCLGPMKRNEVINYRIQGSAFHCLLWTFNNVMKAMKGFKLERSFLIGQVHDSMLLDVHPDDEELIDYLVWKYGTQEIIKYWNWIIVPLKIEKERSEIDGSWAEMTEQGYLEGRREKL